MLQAAAGVVSTNLGSQQGLLGEHGWVRKGLLQPLIDHLGFIQHDLWHNSGVCDLDCAPCARVRGFPSPLTRTSLCASAALPGAWQHSGRSPLVTPGGQVVLLVLLVLLLLAAQSGRGSCPRVVQGAA